MKLNEFTLVINNQIKITKDKDKTTLVYKKRNFKIYLINMMGLCLSLGKSFKKINSSGNILIFPGNYL